MSPDDNTPPDIPHAPGTDTDPHRGEVSEARPDLLRRLLDILGWESGTEEQALEALADAVRVARGGRMGPDVYQQRNEARAECRRLQARVEWLERMLEESNRCSACGCYASDHVVDDEELRECLRCACTQYRADKHPPVPYLFWRPASVDGPEGGAR